MDFTVIDGMILNILTHTTSTQSCPVSEASSSDFIKIKDYKSDKFKPQIAI